MPLEKREIIAALKRKGFAADDSHRNHIYLHYKIGNKYTSVKTFVSRGSGYKTIDDSLLGAMKKQLKLDSLSDLRNLVKCPMSENDYQLILRGKGIALD